MVRRYVVPILRVNMVFLNEKGSKYCHVKVISLVSIPLNSALGMYSNHSSCVEQISPKPLRIRRSDISKTTEALYMRYLLLTFTFSADFIFYFLLDH